MDKLKSQKIFPQADRDKFRKEFKKERDEDGYNCSCCERTIKALDALDAVEKQATEVLKINLQLRSEIVAAKNVMSRATSMMENSSKESLPLKGVLRFELTKEEEEKYKKWKKKLPPADFGAIGGGETFSFTPTGLGCIIKVKRGKHKLDLTDESNW